MIDEKGKDSKLFDPRTLVALEEYYPNIDKLDLKTSDKLKCEALLWGLSFEVRSNITNYYLTKYEDDQTIAITKIDKLVKSLNESEVVKQLIQNKLESINLIQISEKKIDALTNKLQIIINNIDDPAIKKAMQTYQESITLTKSKLPNMSKDQVTNYLNEEEKKFQIIESYTLQASKISQELDFFIRLESNKETPGINFNQLAQDFTNQPINLMKKLADSITNIGNETPDTLSLLKNIQLDINNQKIDIFRLNITEITTYIQKFNKQVEVLKLFKENITRFDKLYDSIFSIKNESDKQTYLTKFNILKNLTLLGQDQEANLKDLENKIVNYRYVMSESNQISLTMFNLIQSIKDNEIKKIIDKERNEIERSKASIIKMSDAELEIYVGDIKLKQTKIQNFNTYLPMINKLDEQIASIENPFDQQYYLNTINNIRHHLWISSDKDKNEIDLKNLELNVENYLFIRNEINTIVSNLSAMSQNIKNIEARKLIEQLILNIETSKTNILQMTITQRDDLLKQLQVSPLNIEQGIKLFESYETKLNTLKIQISAINSESHKMSLLNKINDINNRLIMGEDPKEVVDKLESLIDNYQKMLGLMDQNISKLPTMIENIEDSSKQQAWKDYLSKDNDVRNNLLDTLLNLKRDAEGSLLLEGTPLFDVFNIMSQIEFYDKHIPKIDELMNTLNTFISNQKGEVKIELQLILNEVNHTKNHLFSTMKEMDEDKMANYIDEFINNKNKQLELYKKYPHQLKELAQLTAHISTMSEVISDKKIKSEWKDILSKITKIRSDLGKESPDNINKLIDQYKQKFYQSVFNNLHNINNHFSKSLDDKKSELTQISLALSSAEKSNVKTTEIDNYKNSIIKLSKEITDLNRKISYLVVATKIGFTEFTLETLSKLEKPIDHAADNFDNQSVNVEVASRNYKEKVAIANTAYNNISRMLSQSNKDIIETANNFLKLNKEIPSYEKNKLKLNKELLDTYINSINEYISQIKISESDLNELFGDTFKEIFGQALKLKKDNSAIEMDEAVKIKLINEYASSQFSLLINKTLENLEEKNNLLSNQAAQAVNQFSNQAAQTFNQMTNVLRSTVMGEIANTPMETIETNETNFKLAEHILVSKLNKLAAKNDVLWFQDTISEEDTNQPNLLERVGQQAKDWMEENTNKSPQRYQLQILYGKMVPELQHNSNDANSYINNILRYQSEFKKITNDIVIAPKQAQEILETTATSTAKLLDYEERDKLLRNFSKPLQNKIYKNKNTYGPETIAMNDTLTKQFQELLLSVIPKNENKRSSSQWMVNELYNQILAITMETPKGKILSFKDLYLELIKNTHFRAVLEGKHLKEKVNDFILETNYLTQPLTKKTLAQTQKQTVDLPTNKNPTPTPETSNQDVSQENEPIKQEIILKNKEELLRELIEIVNKRVKDFTNEKTMFKDSQAEKLAKIGSLKSQLYRFLNEELDRQKGKKISGATMKNIIDSIEKHPTMKISGMVRFFKSDVESTLKKTFNEWMANNDASIRKIKSDEIKAKKAHNSPQNLMDELVNTVTKPFKN